MTEQIANTSEVDISTRLIRFHNCRILRNHKIIQEDLWVRNGKIIDPEKVFFDEKLRPDVVS
jgi:N-acetylglucosamine-6-phosphate deacetylase